MSTNAGRMLRNSIVGVVCSALTCAADMPFAAASPTVSADVSTLSPPVDYHPTQRLTWRPPANTNAQRLVITKPGVYDLDSGRDVVIEAPRRIDGPVHLRGGRHVTWIGGHIRIPRPSSPSYATARRGLVVSDHNGTRGNPRRYGPSRPGRVIHLEGLLIDGPGLAEGVNTNAPSADVQIENTRIVGVGFENSDDRDGVRGWPGKNHPDVIQTWGSQRSLRIDGLTGTSAYQGIFLKEDAKDSVKGQIWLRRVDVRAIEKTGSDGVRYAGHRMFSRYSGKSGRVYLDAGTVRVASHRRSGWNHLRPKSGNSGFWRGRYWDSSRRRHVLETPPSSAQFADALGDERPTRVGRDRFGQFAEWAGSGIVDWSGRQAGRVYEATPGAAEYVPAAAAGASYVSPGYLATSGR